MKSGAITNLNQPHDVTQALTGRLLFLPIAVIGEVVGVIKLLFY
jgi:hypothetical protein